MKNVLLVASVQSHIAQFHRPLIRILKEAGYEIHVAARDNLQEKNGLIIPDVDLKYNVPFERFPLKPRNVAAYRQMKQIIASGDYDIISCNTPAAGVISRLAARKARKNGTKVIYTAHGFHFFKGASLKNWILYYPIEKVMAPLCDVLITITREDYILARKRFRTEVKRIHGVGADEKKYLAITEEENLQFRQDMGYAKRFVILCTGELNENKNQSILIQAMDEVRKIHPEVLLLLAGNGPKEEALRELIRELKLEQNVQLIGYHTDLEKYTNVCDLVVSVSGREGLPLNIVEAQMCGKAVIVSHNRGHNELVKDGYNGVFVDRTSTGNIAETIVKLIEDSDLRNKLAANGKKTSIKYRMEIGAGELKEIYLNER